MVLKMLLFEEGNTLKDSRLKSILIQLDIERVEYAKAVFDILEDSGLTLTKKGLPPVYEDGKFKGVINHIFTRS